MNDAIAREAAYDEGYEAGKLCASQQILDELEEAFTKRREEYKQKRAEHPEIEYPEADSYWLGRACTCTDVLCLLEQLKKKYGVD